MEDRILRHRSFKKFHKTDAQLWRGPRVRSGHEYHHWGIFAHFAQVAGPSVASCAAVKREINDLNAAAISLQSGRQQTALWRRLLTAQGI